MHTLFNYPQSRIFETKPLAIVDSPAAPTHFMQGRAGFQPLWIQLRHTGGTDSLAWLRYSSSPRVSTHRLITKAGINHKIVKDEDTAFCAGFAEIGPIDGDGNDPPGVPFNNNLCSLNIEFENLGNGRDPYPMSQMTMGVRQIIEWWGKYGFLPILGHGHVDARKDDPAGFDWQLMHRLLWAELRLIGI